MSKETVHSCVCAECRKRKSDTRDYHKSVNRVIAELDERSRRLFVGLLARQLGRGGIARVVEITGISRMTIRRGLNECEAGQPVAENRIRQPGGGRKTLEKKTLALLKRSANF